MQSEANQRQSMEIHEVKGKPSKIIGNNDNDNWWKSFKIGEIKNQWTINERQWKIRQSMKILWASMKINGKTTEIDENPRETNEKPLRVKFYFYKHRLRIGLLIQTGTKWNPFSLLLLLRLLLLLFPPSSTLSLHPTLSIFSVSLIKNDLFERQL